MCMCEDGRCVACVLTLIAFSSPPKTFSSVTDCLAYFPPMGWWSYPIQTLMKIHTSYPV